MTEKKLNAWEVAQSHLQTRIDEYSYKNWFAQTRFGSYKDGVLVVHVPSHFFARWLQDHYMEAINDSLRETLSDFKQIEFVPANDLGSARKSRSETKKGTKKTGRKHARSYVAGNSFNARYTFDRFVVGSGNRFAHAAAEAVTKSPARAYNPLFLYGPTGMGKTHLMQAIGQAILANMPNANVVYISSETFTNELIEAIGEKSTSRFRAKYRRVDVLLIDDIHFIRRKEATQEEFFHTFNELYDMHKQIVLSSDCGPKEIEGLEARLVSRFEWGLVTDIQPPDMETRVAILQKKSQEEKINVPPDVLNYIASSVTSNIRELEGALVTTLAFGKLTHKAITVAMAEEVLRDLIGSASVKLITVETVQRAVADYFDVRLSDLKGRSRERQIAYPRQVAMYISKKLCPTLSLKELGDAFGGKHHTTVLYACREVSSSEKKDEKTRQLLLKLEKAVRA